MKKGIYFIIALLFLFSCGREYSRVMDSAEAQMMQAPDSALTLMQSITAKDLPTRGLRARHALLLTMAKNKCYQDISSDTTVRMSYDWYQRHGSTRYKMLSSYYLGYVEQERGNSIEAVLAFREAELLAEELTDYRKLSLVDQHLSAIFATNYDHVRALEYAEKSLEAANKAGEKLMADWCKLDIAAQLINKLRLNEAYPLLKDILNNHSSERSDLYYFAALTMATVMYYCKPGQIDSARWYIQQVIDSKKISLDSRDYGLLALLSEEEGKHSEADNYLYKAEQNLRTALDSVAYYNDWRNMYDLRGDWKHAYESKNKSVVIQDQITLTKLEQSLSHAMEIYYKDKMEINHERVQSRLYLALVIGLIFMAIAISLYLLERSQRCKLLEEMAQAQTVGEELKRLEFENEQTYRLVEGFISEKVRSLQQIAESYFSWEDTSVRMREEKKGRLMKDEMITAFRKQLEQLRNEHSLILALEQSLNITDNGIMKKARSFLKKEKELDFSVLVLLFSGFSIKSISYLLRMSEASLRMRKTRYKQFFSSLPSPERELFLSKIQ
ncbi:MAG: hypothetical protein IJV27_03280 [Prevotella sp.]|nr:hypothetical protein [Prevotella sp.]